MTPETRATKAELRREIAELRSIGGQMSNVCFNLSQRSAAGLGEREKEIMSELRIKWDAIRRAEG